MRKKSEFFVISSSPLKIRLPSLWTKHSFVLFTSTTHKISDFSNKLNLTCCSLVTLDCYLTFVLFFTSTSCNISIICKYFYSRYSKEYVAWNKERGAESSNPGRSKTRGRSNAYKRWNGKIDGKIEGVLWREKTGAWSFIWGSLSSLSLFVCESVWLK